MGHLYVSRNVVFDELMFPFNRQYGHISNDFHAFKLQPFLKTLQLATLLCDVSSPVGLSFVDPALNITQSPSSPILSHVDGVAPYVSQPAPTPTHTYHIHDYPDPGRYTKAKSLPLPPTSFQHVLWPI